MSLKDTLKKAKKLETLLAQSAQRQQTGSIDKNSLSANFKNNNSDNDEVNISVLRTMVKPRNYLALNPLLQKGGVHEKEDIDIVRKKRRRETKQQLRQTDWMNEL